MERFCLGGNVPEKVVGRSTSTGSPHSLRGRSGLTSPICVGNSMICSRDIWHKYHEWCFEIVIRLKHREWYLCQISRTNHAITAVFVYRLYTTTRKKFVIFTYRYFKLSWNIAALSQSNCRNFSYSSITMRINQNFGRNVRGTQREYSSKPLKHSIVKRISIGNSMICNDIWHKYHEWYFKIFIRNFTSR